MVQNNKSLFEYVLMAIVVIFTVLLIVTLYNKYVEKSPIEKLLEGDTIINIQNQGTTNTQTDLTSENSQSLCDLYTDYYPTYFMVKEVECGLAGGDYICENDKIGCYNIGSWNSSLCTSGEPQVQTLKASCLSLESDWTCTATEISCER